MKTAWYCLVLGITLIVSCSSGDKNQGLTSVSGSNQSKITDDSLLTLLQYRTFQYFWLGAEPNSGMARERFHVDGIYPENDMNVVTSGGRGFGLMAILVGIERGFITREEAYSRFCIIVDFLKKSDRFHGAWSHWIYEETGKVKPFSSKDNGADIVETTYLIQGLLAVRQYFMDGSKNEKVLSAEIDKLWKEVEWNWFPQRYLAIDQGPAVVMIENYRTGLIWNLFMSCTEIQTGLKSLGFTTGKSY